MPQSTYMILAMIIAVVAFCVGALVSYLAFGSRKTKEEPEAKAETPAAEAGEETAEPAERNRPVFRMLKDPKDVTLIELRGRTFRSPALMSPEDRREVEDAARCLLIWLGITQRAEPEPIPAPVASPAPVDSVEPPAETPLPPAEPNSIDDRLFMASAQPEPSVRTAAPLRVTPAPVRGTGPLAVKPEPRRANTIVEQIDAILQDLLPCSPLAGKDIHVTEQPGFGVIVWVGAQRFEGIEAVTDPDARQLLRQAVEEWERAGA